MWEEMDGAICGGAAIVHQSHQAGSGHLVIDPVRDLGSVRLVPRRTASRHHIRIRSDKNSRRHDYDDDDVVRTQLESRCVCRDAPRIRVRVSLALRQRPCPCPCCVVSTHNFPTMQEAVDRPPGQTSVRLVS